MSILQGTLSEELYPAPPTVYFLESADGTMKVVVVFSPQEQNIEDPTEEVTDYRKLFGPLDGSVYHIQVSSRDVYLADLCLNLI